MSMVELQKVVEEWAKERDLHNNDYKKQAFYLLSEYGELVDGVLKNDREKIMDSIGDILVVEIIYAMQRGMNIDWDISKNVGKEENVFRLLNVLVSDIKRITDIVTYADWTYEAIKQTLDYIPLDLQYIAKLYDTTIEECLQYAYEEIKDRKGKTVDGVFVKEEAKQ